MIHSLASLRDALIIFFGLENIGLDGSVRTKSEENVGTSLPMVVGSGIRIENVAKKSFIPVVVTNLGEGEKK